MVVIDRKVYLDLELPANEDNVDLVLGVELIGDGPGLGLQTITTIAGST